MAAIEWHLFLLLRESDYAMGRERFGYTRECTMLDARSVAMGVAYLWLRCWLKRYVPETIRGRKPCMPCHRQMEKFGTHTMRGS